MIQRAHPARRGEPVCPDCWEKEAQGRRIREFESISDRWALEEAKAAGMAPRELKASRERIPVEIKRALPAERVLALLNGEIPSQGWGIGSKGTGGGKTLAFAAVFREAIRAHGLAEVRAGRDIPTRPWLVWEPWPAAVDWIRKNATSEGFQRFVDRLVTAPVLFLDDLGSERIKGSYVEDFAASQLDVVVDERYRHERPIFYTTNLNEGGLLDFYGARLVSRLCGDNPLFFVEGLPDQRIQR